LKLIPVYVKYLLVLKVGYSSVVIVIVILFYSCKEDSQVDSDKCILHDEEYLRLGIGSFLEEKKNNVRTKVMDKVRKSIDDEESLFFIGCYLPDVTIGASIF
jgi:hypothetical protein